MIVFLLCCFLWRITPRKLSNNSSCSGCSNNFSEEFSEEIFEGFYNVSIQPHQFEPEMEVRSNSEGNEGSEPETNSYNRNEEDDRVKKLQLVSLISNLY